MTGSHEPLRPGDPPMTLARPQEDQMTRSVAEVDAPDVSQSDAFDLFWNAHGVTVPFTVPLATYIRGEVDAFGEFQEDSLSRDCVNRKGNVSFGIGVLRG